MALNEEERWCFDLDGFICVPGVIPPADCDALRSQAAAWCGLPTVEPPLAQNGGVAEDDPAHPNTDPSCPRVVQNVHYEPLFQQLLRNGASVCICDVGGQSQIMGGEMRELACMYGTRLRWTPPHLRADDSEQV